MLMHGRASRLNQVHVAAAHTFLNFDVKFAIGKARERPFSERQAHPLCNRRGKREVGGANENDRVHRLPLDSFSNAHVQADDDSVDAEDVPCIHLGHLALGVVDDKPFQSDYGGANGHVDAIGVDRRVLFQNQIDRLRNLIVAVLLDGRYFEAVDDIAAARTRQANTPASRL